MFIELEAGVFMYNYLKKNYYQNHVMISLLRVLRFITITQEIETIITIQETKRFLGTKQ